MVVIVVIIVPHSSIPYEPKVSCWVRGSTLGSWLWGFSGFGSSELWGVKLQSFGVKRFGHVGGLGFELCFLKFLLMCCLGT